MPKKPFKLKRTQQCEKCPWKVGVDPNTIPNEYNPEKHANLHRTIAKDGVVEQVCAYLNNSPEKPLRLMACHEEHDTPCLGWLMNQLGRGNNIGLRIEMMGCKELADVKLDGPQHETFEDTLPKT